MKRLFIPLTLVIFLTACAPAAPVPTATPLPPTVTVTAAATSTTTIEPTATVTVEPTEVPMPDGWTAITETREIGGRQVALNEAGDAATQIDGEWYPVDARGCFYKEFFDPKNQTDPKIDELIQKINGEPSIYLSGDHEIGVRHYGSNHTGYIPKSDYPRYLENTTDAIIYDQMLCYNSQTSRWSHVFQYVHPYDSKATPNTSKVMRSTVGWMDKGEFITFTYKERGSESQKAATVQEAFQMWKDLIDRKEQVAIGIPVQIKLNNKGVLTEEGYEAAVRQLTTTLPVSRPDQWQNDLTDPQFIQWMMLEENQIKYRSDKKNWPDLSGTNRVNYWRHFGELAADGNKMGGDLVARVVYTK